MLNYWATVSVKEFLRNSHFDDTLFTEKEIEEGYAEIGKHEIMEAINKSAEHNPYLYGVLAEMAGMEREWEDSKEAEPIIYEMAKK